MTTTDENVLLSLASQGDQESWGTLLMQHRERLRRMVALRMDRRLQGRLDPSDIVQEAWLEASQRLADYIRRPTMPFFLWLRFLVGQKLITLHRHHFDAKMRDVNREVQLGIPMPEASSVVMAHQFASHEPLPSEVVQQAERRQIYEQVLESLDPNDREIIALRHFEQLSNAEAAQALGIREAAASKRYIRAMHKLKSLLEERSIDGLEMI